MKNNTWKITALAVSAALAMTTLLGSCSFNSSATQNYENAKAPDVNQSGGFNRKTSGDSGSTDDPIGKKTGGSSSSSGGSGGSRSSSSES